MASYKPSAEGHWQICLLANLSWVGFRGPKPESSVAPTAENMVDIFGKVVALGNW